MLPVNYLEFLTLTKATANRFGSKRERRFKIAVVKAFILLSV